MPWVLEEVKDRLKCGFDQMSVDELCALWYLCLTLVFLLSILFVVGIMKFCEWSQFYRTDLYVFVYSFSVFQILFSKLRCRVESQGQYSSSKRTEVNANKTKSDSIHLLRSLLAAECYLLGNEVVDWIHFRPLEGEERSARASNVRLCVVRGFAANRE